jgi:predicted phage terminase large subunit-like protein
MERRLEVETDPDRILLLTETIRRERAIASPVAFAVHVTRGLASPYIPYEWVRYLNSHLVALEQRNIELLLIEAPVRHGKSELVSVYFPAWYLGRNPDHRVILGGHNETFASRFGRRTRNLLRQWGPSLFGVSVSGERFAAKDWNLGGVWRGGMVSTGVGNPPTGAGGNLIVLDDPVKSYAEAYSPTKREQLYEWWREDIRSRFEPGAVCVIVMSRRHEDDLSGRIKTAELEARGEIIDGPRDRWTILRLPGRAEANDPLGRAPGEALCPERYPLDSLLKLERSMGPVAFSAMIQNAPAPAEGLLFKINDWRYAKAAPAGINWVRWWDLASSDPSVSSSSDPDWTVGVLVGRDDNGVIWIADVERFRLEPAAREKRIRLIAENDLARGVKRQALPQDPGEGKTTGRHYIANVFGPLGVYAKAYPVKGSKGERAGPYAGQQGANNVVLVIAGWNEVFTKEHRDFPNGSHDDQVDAAAMGVQDVLGLLGGRARLVL